MQTPKGMAARISGRTLVILMLAAVIAGVIFVWIAFQSLGSSSGTAQMTGSLFISGSGPSHAGADTTSYNASISAAGGSGSLVLVPNGYVRDSVEVHNFTVSDLSVTPSSVSMLLDGNPVKLVWTANDTVWNGEFDNYYIASWGPAAPLNELRGSISPAVFPGIPSNYYLEFRLTGTVTDQTPSFLIPQSW